MCGSMPSGKLITEVLYLTYPMAPHFLPWHGVITGNDKQMVRALTHREEDIGAVVGAGMASTTISINQG